MAVASDRILGLDVARGLAILGMFAAHTVQQPDFSWADPSSWGAVVNGRSSILFAILAGISLAILSGRRTPVDGLALVQARMRILIRAVIVFGIGGVLALLGSGIAVILEYYAVIFVLSLPFLRWSPRRLFAAAGVWAVVGPVLVVLLKSVVAWSEGLLTPPAPMGSALYEYLTGFYPVVTWVVFMLLGLGVGRLAIESTRVQAGLVAVGAGICAVGYALGSLLAPLGAPMAAFGVERLTADVHSLDGVIAVTGSSLLGAAPHSGSPFEVVGSSGFALAVIGLCLLAARARPMRVLLTPLSSMGQMALTIYTAQVVAVWVLVVSTQQRPNDWAVFWCFAVASMAIAVLWRALRGQGPLERLLSTVSKRAADPRPRAADGAGSALLESPVRPGEGTRVPSSTTSKENHPHG
ncbi:MAG: hypothetical protein BGO95_09740 [Micrococcales bacterium 73-13]|nr:MAG: hypothetical protein BGO95_09740 [Micrococcales bacterium 73-13]